MLRHAQRITPRITRHPLRLTGMSPRAHPSSPRWPRAPVGYQHRLAPLQIGTGTAHGGSEDISRDNFLARAQARVAPTRAFTTAFVGCRCATGKTPMHLTLVPFSECSRAYGLCDVFSGLGYSVTTMTRRTGFRRTGHACAVRPCYTLPRSSTPANACCRLSAVWTRSPNDSDATALNPAVWYQLDAGTGRRSRTVHHHPPVARRWPKFIQIFRQFVKFLTFRHRSP